MTNGVKFLVACLGIIIICVALGLGAFWATINTPDPMVVVQQTTIASRDLVAQESMAFWAFIMALLSSISLLITSLGTYLIFNQVRLTRDAVRDTQVATTAMLRQTELVENGQRPWLSIMVNRLGPIFRGTDGRYTCEYQFTIKNTGKSPAVTIGLNIGAEKSNSFGRICAESFVAEAYKTISLVSSSIAPDSEEEFSGSVTFEIDNIDENGLRENKSCPGIWLGAAYKDRSSEKILYTLEIYSPGVKITPGFSPEMFMLRPVKLKTIFGTIGNF
jgi:hypothetical protein